tara:strand:+ start:1267 stop:2370 length:1104 start_codon:yes stop_codon:yes gene_type:complete
MKRFLIASTMLMSASAFTAFADDPQDTTMADGNDLSQAVTETIDNSDLDRGPFTDDHDWIETSVYASDGTELGEVERVRLTADGEVDGLVVETGGVLEIGGREVLIENGDYRLTTVEDEGRIELTATQAEFQALPDFNEDAASEYPLSDDDYNDDEMDEEIVSEDDGDDVAVNTETETESNVAMSHLTTDVDNGAMTTASLDDQADRHDGNDLTATVGQAWDNSDLDRTPFTDDHAWIETNVYGSDGAELGEVERVRLSSEGEVEAIVVEYGGTLEIGGREVLIESADFDLETIVETDNTVERSMDQMDSETRIVLAFDSAAFAALPDFNEDAASEYPLSDDDYNDDQMDTENDMEDDMSMGDESGS